MFENFTRARHETHDGVIDLTKRQKKASAETGTDIAKAPDPAPEESKLAEWLELKSDLHNALLERLNLSVIDKVERAELRREVAQVVTQNLASRGMPLAGEDFNRLVDELLDEILGFGPLEPLLADPGITDILVNGHRTVYVERAGRLQPAPIRFRDERHLLRVIDKIVSRMGRRIDESQPWVDARLEDGSRVNAIIRPCAIDGPSLSIRKFSAKPYTLDRLVENGALSREAGDLLRALVAARFNILISGGTGSGKTTMLNAMSAFIDD
jgi:pilus assembly protein CpaF